MLEIHKSWIKCLEALQKEYGINKGKELFIKFCYSLGDVMKFHYDEVEFKFNIKDKKVFYNIFRDEDELINLEDLFIDK